MSARKRNERPAPDPSRCVILVDNSNLFIGGQKYSARVKGVETPEPGRDAAIDPSWRLKFDALLVWLADGREVEAALMAGAAPPGMDGVWHGAREDGFQVFVGGRRHGDEKAVDTELVARAAEIIATSPEPMTLVVASGDLAFLPLVELARRHGWRTELAAFSTDFDPQGPLARAVDRVRLLDDAFERISHYEWQWPAEQPA